MLSSLSKKITWSIRIFGLLLIGCGLFFSLQPTTKHPARAFLDSLTKSQLKEAQHEFNHLQRENWHFFPVAMLGRSGITIKSLTKDQRALFTPLLQQYLSETGYDKTMRIINLENVLAQLENNPTFRDAGLYVINFYGQPEDAMWAWSFEGHHVSLNFTTVDGKVSMVPRFLGANPAEVREGPHKGERVLAKEEDLAFALLDALSAKQKQTAIFQQHSIYDLATSTSSQVGPLRTVGIAFSDLDKAQQAMLLDIINEYLRTMPQDIAKKRMQGLMEEDLEDIHFAWAGATQKGKPHYYRIQGKTFLIEFDNSQNNANHIHTVWRDFDGDFGRDIIREHYEQHQH